MSVAYTKIPLHRKALLLSLIQIKNLKSVKALLSYSCKLEIGIILHSFKWDIRAMQCLKPQRFPFPGRELKEQLGIHLVELSHYPHIRR